MHYILYTCVCVKRCYKYKKYNKFNKYNKYKKYNKYNKYKKYKSVYHFFVKYLYIQYNYKNIFIFFFI